MDRWAVLVVIVVVVVVGCSKSEGSHPSAPLDGGAVVKKASADASAATSVEAELALVARRWNDALAKRDADALREVYGARVRLYTASSDRDEVVKTKRAAFRAAPDYTQTIGPVDFDLHDPKLPRAEFDKKWTQGGKTSSVRASLVFTREDGRWLIVEESDAKTLARMAKDGDGCLPWVHRVVASTEDGKAWVPPKYSTHFVCGPPECEEFQIAAKQLNEREQFYETLARYEVNPKTGVVQHAGIVLQANPSDVAKMKAACAKEMP